jgi:hypothetical protein
MSGPCCRRKAVKTSPSAHPCARLEQGGANYLVYPIVTASTLLITTDTEQNGRKLKVDLASLLAASRCDGPTCRWFQGELPTILAAAAKRPEIFQRYSQSGLSISELSRLARTVLRS